MVGHMDAIQDRHVLVNAKALDDALELSRAAVERLPKEDPLALALRGALAQLRSNAIIEP